MSLVQNLVQIWLGEAEVSDYGSEETEVRIQFEGAVGKEIQDAMLGQHWLEGARLAKNTGKKYSPEARQQGNQYISCLEVQ